MTWEPSSIYETNPRGSCEPWRVVISPYHPHGPQVGDESEPVMPGSPLVDASRPAPGGLTPVFDALVADLARPAASAGRAERSTNSLVHLVEELVATKDKTAV